MPIVRSTVRRAKLATAAVLTAGALVLAPSIASSAQADDTPFYLLVTWHLYDYQINKVPLFSQSDAIQTDANALAQQYANCTSTCLYVTPTLPGLASHTTLFFSKIGWRGLPGSDLEAAAIATSLETTAGPTLLNSYYNYGGVGVYMKGDSVYSVLIMTHYLVLTPTRTPVPAPQ